MARGRGGAAVLLVLIIVGIILVTMSGGAEAATTYTVGDYGGWKFNVRGWARGKTFRTGDVLEFRYNRAVHDVAVVDAAAYRSCSKGNKGRWKALRSGHDKVRLVRGTHYFICTVRGHCKANMKIAVRVI